LYHLNMDNFELTPQEKAAVERLGVEALVLFGSRALGNYRTGSDYDLGVLLRYSKDAAAMERRREIYDSLYELFSSKIKKLVNIDIVFLESAPAELQMHAVKRGIALFERDPSVFARFKERVMLLYADFAPLRELFHKAILSRISA